MSESDGCGLLARIGPSVPLSGQQNMSNPENTIRNLVQEIVHLTRKVIELEQERNQYQQERHHYQHRFLEERQKRLHVERELLEKQDPNYLEGVMDGFPASHAQATMDRASQTDASS